MLREREEQGEWSVGAKDVSEGFSARPVSLTAPCFLKQVLRTETETRIRL